jgi:riboflavin synthase alpha subunit
MVKVSEQTLRLMDREDETAEELNEWCKRKGSITVEGEVLTPAFNFHNFKVFQLQETRDVINFGTAITYGGNKIIIYYDYTLIS